MKLCILGGGGFRTPFVYQALLRDGGSPRVDHVALYDTDPDRLRTMERITRELGRGFPDAPRIEATGDLRAALTDSDFVFAALRVGGLEGRRGDEHVALDLGVLGQETTGPGGLAYALRGVPVMVDIARVVAEVAPQACVLNFTNPAGIVTEAMQQVLGDRVLGICDTPSGLLRRIADALDLPPEEVQPDYLGLNHLGWMRRVLHHGHDVLPQLLADDARLARLEETHVFGADWLRALGAVPNEYVYYYDRTREAVATIREAATTRGDFLAQTQPAFYREARGLDGAALLDAWRATVARREASYMAEATGGTQERPVAQRQIELDPSQQGYAGVALAVMTAISRDERSTMILNVRNRGTIAALPADAVIEVPTLVDAQGVHPLVTAPPDLHQLGLISQLKAVERRIIAAALSGSRREAVAAFALHPLVDGVDVARRLVEGYVARIPEVAAVLTQP